MFCIVLIGRAGKIKSALAFSVEECKKRAQEICELYPEDFIASTIPYSASRIEASLYDLSVPFEIMQTLGLELRLLLEKK